MQDDQPFLIDSTTFLSQCSRMTRDPFHKAFFQWQMTKISDKSADNQSQANISVAYTKIVIFHWWQVVWKAPQNWSLSLRHSNERGDKFIAPLGAYLRGYPCFHIRQVKWALINQKRVDSQTKWGRIQDIVYVCHHHWWQTIGREIEDRNMVKNLFYYYYYYFYICMTENFMERYGEGRKQ